MKQLKLTYGEFSKIIVEIECTSDGADKLDKPYLRDAESIKPSMSNSLSENLLSNNDILTLFLFQMNLPISNPLVSLCRNVLDKLILSKLDAHHGICVVAEESICNGLMVNISQPGVLCQCYGINTIDEVKDNLITRATYGYNRSIGTDPDKFITKSFDNNPITIYITMIKLSTHNSGELAKEMNLNTVFNSCKVLAYYSIPDIKEVSYIGWYCDAKYSLMGNLKHLKTHKYKTHLLLLLLMVKKL